MIILKSPREIESMRKAGQVVGKILQELKSRVEPGISTGQINQWAEELIKQFKAKPAFKGYKGFPYSICTSLNEEVVHGIPSEKRILKEGDLLSLDFGVIVEGYYGDSALSLVVGKETPLQKKLIQVTEKSLWKGIEQMKVKNHLHDVSQAVQRTVEAEGFSVVRDFVGHGIGQKLHEEPPLPNYGESGTGPLLKAGMVLAIEPMVNEGKPEVRILDDGWTAVTQDGKLSCHFEHTVAILSDGPEILTDIKGTSPKGEK